MKRSSSDTARSAEPCITARKCPEWYIACGKDASPDTAPVGRYNFSIWEELILTACFQKRKKIWQLVKVVNQNNQRAYWLSAHSQMNRMPLKLSKSSMIWRNHKRKFEKEDICSGYYHDLFFARNDGLSRQTEFQTRW